MAADLVFLDVDVQGRRTDVVVRHGVVSAVGPGVGHDVTAITVVRGEGRALLPGLHDHHVHLLALEASRRSLDLQQSSVPDAATLARLARTAASALGAREPLRVVGYHESMAGNLTAHDLDAWGLGRPVRVQHRSGAMWIVDSLTLASLPNTLPDGAEIAADGRPNGRFHRCDQWLGQFWRPSGVDLLDMSRMLAGHGITGVTDMTPYSELDQYHLLASQALDGRLAQRVVVTGGPSLARATFPAPLGTGPVKILVDEARVPSLEDLVTMIATAHDAGRPVAIHCIGRVVLALCVAAFEEAGRLEGDRLEHASVVPPELVPPVARLGCTVVTQPGFVHARGDRYLDDVEDDDQPHLWPCASLRAAGIPVAFGTDAPYGPVNPWLAMATACNRRTAGGATMSLGEAVSPQAALDMFLTPLDHPGGVPRRVEVGLLADLCLLDRPHLEALEHLATVRVTGTWIAGNSVGDQP